MSKIVLIFYLFRFVGDYCVTMFAEEKFGYWLIQKLEKGPWRAR